jgi:hypothetical protein
MELVEALRSGALGVAVELPPEREVTASGGAEYAFTGAGQVAWQYLFRPVALDLAAASEAALAADVEVTARAIFRHTEAVFAAREPPHPLRARGPDGVPCSRLDDASWSPVIERATVAIGGAPALRVIHRVTYGPGREIVMGHLTVPVAAGVLELRLIAIDHTTGLRESVLMLAGDLLLKAVAPAGERSVPPQSHFDDPAHDARFPSHCLSRVRAALAWSQAPGRLRVTVPATAAWREVVDVAALGGTISLPPRFVLVGADDHGAAFTRVNFALTDGVWRLLALASPARGLAAEEAPLLRHAVAALARHCGVTDLSRARIATADAEDGTLRLGLGLEGSDGVPRVESLWWRARPDEFAGVVLSAPEHVTQEEALDTLLEVVSSWRPHAPRPWWRFW